MSRLETQGIRERRRTVCHVTYLVNAREPEAFEFGDRMAAAGIDHATLPTSGLTTLVVDGIASYGPAAIRYSVDYLIAQQRNLLDPLGR